MTKSYVTLAAAVLAFSACKSGRTAPSTTRALPPVANTAAAPIVELRGGTWLSGTAFEAGSRFMQSGRFIAPPATRVDSIIALDGLWLVPPYADAHTHSPESEWGFDGIRDMFLTAGVFYVQVLANHRTGRQAITGLVNIPASIDAVFADAAITASGGHPQVLYESLSLFRTQGQTTAQRQQASRSVTQNNDAYMLLDSLPELPALVQRLRRDSIPLLKVMVLDADHYAAHAADSMMVGLRGLDPRVLRPLVDSAHAMGRRVWAHVETARDFEIALDAGVDAFAHVPGYGAHHAADSALGQYWITDATILKAVARRVTVVSTLGLSYEDTQRDTVARRRIASVTAENVRRLARAGVTIVTGSDTYSSPEAITNDANAVGAALNMSPVQQLLLRSFTTPRAIFPTRRIGMLVPGYEASLLALECDPSQDVACHNRIARRLKQGHWVTVAPPGR